MSNRLTRSLTALALVFATSNFALADNHAKDEARKEAKPIKALLVTGGGFHDYAKQKDLLTEGTAARANIEWTIAYDQRGERTALKHEVFEKEKWWDGYDIVVHNICCANIKDRDWVSRITEAHKTGTACAIIHCSMHSYRAIKDDNEWRKCIGITSMRHQQHVPFTIENIKSDHPIMKKFPERWTTPRGELYEVLEIGENTVPLAQAFGVRTKTDHVCIWTNTYGKAKVFGTTVGHHNETVAHPRYLDFITRGMLWACDKLDEEGNPLPGYEVKDSKLDVEAEALEEGEEKKEQVNEKATLNDYKLPAVLDVEGTIVPNSASIDYDEIAADPYSIPKSYVSVNENLIDGLIHSKGSVLLPAGDNTYFGVPKTNLVEEFVHPQIELPWLIGDSGAGHFARNGSSSDILQQPTEYSEQLDLRSANVTIEVEIVDEEANAREWTTTG